MILDSLSEGETLRLDLKSRNSKDKLVSEGIIAKNNSKVLILNDTNIGPLLSCRVLKYDVESNDVPVKVLFSDDSGFKIKEYKMRQFKAQIDID